MLMYYQIIQAVEEMNINIGQLKKEIFDAKARHAEATKDIKRIEKDMNDFNDNKDDKLAELQSSVEKLKKALIKNSVSVKSLQKELQSARMESEQVASDIAAAQEQLAEADASVKGQNAELQDLEDEQRRAKVSTSTNKQSPILYELTNPPYSPPTMRSNPVSPPNAPNSPPMTKNSSPSTKQPAPRPPS